MAVQTPAQSTRGRVWVTLIMAGVFMGAMGLAYATTAVRTGSARQMSVGGLSLTMPGDWRALPEATEGRADVQVLEDSQNPGRRVLVAALEGVPANAPPEMVLESRLRQWLGAPPLRLPHGPRVTPLQTRHGLRGARYEGATRASHRATDRDLVRAHLLMLLTDENGRYWLIHLSEPTTTRELYPALSQNLQKLTAVQQSAQLEDAP